MSLQKLFILNGESGWKEKLIDVEKEIPKAVLNTWGPKFKHITVLDIENGVFYVKDLIGLTMYYNTEFGVYIQDGRMFVKKGNPPNVGEGKGGSVSFPKESKVLIHVHPTCKSYRAHLEIDLQNSTDEEAIVDLSYNYIVINKNSVYNKKNSSDNSYISFYEDQNGHEWPSFLNRTAPYNITIEKS